MNTLTKHINIKRLLGSIAFCEMVGVAAALFTMDAIRNWYVDLNKPDFNPPNWIFGPVWTLLYFLMAISFYNTLQTKIKDLNYRRTNVFFTIQLTLNFCWTVAFFGLRNPTLAFAVILLLITSTCFWILHLQKIHKNSALMQIPYLLWCCFACVLNYYIIKLN